MTQGFGNPFGSKAAHAFDVNETNADSNQVSVIIKDKAELNKEEVSG